MYLGIDIGSSSSKAVIIDENSRVLGMWAKNAGIGSDGPKEAVEKALAEAKLTASDIKFSVVTGYGRFTYTDADKQIAELSCHTKGAVFLIPSARTLIDVGGQDAKVIRIDENGSIKNFAMNDKCAAGTGRFLEVMARVLCYDVDKLADIAEFSEVDVDISSTCAVFAESEVISQLALGVKHEDVARGAHASIARRINGLVGRVGVMSDVVMTGGVAKNADVVSELKKVLGAEIIVPEFPQLMGAFGAALYAKDNYERKSEVKE